MCSNQLGFTPMPSRPASRLLWRSSTLQLKMTIPGSEWGVGALMRMQRLGVRPRGVPNPTGLVEIRAVAAAAVLNIEAERQEEEVAPRELGILDDIVGVDSYIINMYRRCLGAPIRRGLCDPSKIFSVHSWIALLECRSLCLARRVRRQCRDVASSPYQMKQVSC